MKTFPKTQTHRQSVQVTNATPTNPRNINRNPQQNNTPEYAKQAPQTARVCNINKNTEVDCKMLVESTTQDEYETPESTC